MPICVIERIWSDFDRRRYDALQINGYFVENVLFKRRVVKKRLAICTHSDNPLSRSTNYYEEGHLHFDGPIYIFGIEGEGTLSCGVFKQNVVFDETQSYRIKPRTIVRMADSAWWNSKHCVLSGSLPAGRRVVGILRSKHNLCSL